MLKQLVFVGVHLSKNKSCRNFKASFDAGGLNLLFQRTEIQFFFV